MWVSQGGFGLRKLWQDYELCLFVQWNYLPMLCGINRVIFIWIYLFMIRIVVLWWCNVVMLIFVYIRKLHIRRALECIILLYISWLDYFVSVVILHSPRSSALDKTNLIIELLSYSSGFVLVFCVETIVLRLIWWHLLDFKLILLHCLTADSCCLLSIYRRELIECATMAEIIVGRGCALIRLFLNNFNIWWSQFVIYSLVLQERLWFWFTFWYAFLIISHNQTSLDSSFTHQYFVLYNFLI
jgi:hypothetical protein